jgi:hypothetical protein
MFIRNFILALIAVCACSATSFAQHGRLPVPQPTTQPTPAPRGGNPPAPTMKKPERVEVPPLMARRSYDPAHDTTYLNVPVTLLSHEDEKRAGGAVAFAGRELTLTFQLAYKGKRTEDLAAVYVFLESTTAEGEGDKLSAVERLGVKADDYRYAYARLSYKTASVSLAGAARVAPTVRKEVVVFKLTPDDLSQIAGANRLELQLGAEAFTVRSPQLTDLRRTLANGDRQ